jgi:hypothetical protein
MVIDSMGVEEIYDIMHNRHVAKLIYHVTRNQAMDREGVFMHDEMNKRIANLNSSRINVVNKIEASKDTNEIKDLTKQLSDIDNGLENLGKFRTYFFKAEYLRRLNHFFTLNQGYKNTDYDVYSKIRKGEMYMRNNISRFAKGDLSYNFDEWLENHLSYFLPERRDNIREMETEMEKIGKIGHVVNNIPNIKAYFNSLNFVFNAIHKQTYKFAKASETAMMSIAQSQKLGKTMPEYRFYSVLDGIEGFLFSDYMNRLGETVNVKGIKLDLKNFHVRQQFMMLFPEYVNELKAAYSTDEKKNNMFLADVEFNDSGDVVFRNNFTLDADSLHNYKMEFAKLDPQIRHLFGLYSLMKYRGYSKSSLRDIVDTKEQAHFYNQLEIYANELNNPKSRISKMMLEDFTISGVMKNDQLMPTLDNTNYGVQAQKEVGIFKLAG